MQYEITRELSIPAVANNRYADISLSEHRRAERSTHGFPRVIGGDKGDVGFNGYTVYTEQDKTVLYKPTLITSDENLTPDEVYERALEILMTSYESIGVECVEHG